MVDTAFNPLATIVAGVHYAYFAPLGTALPAACPTEPGGNLNAAFGFAGYTADTGAAFQVDTQTQDLYASQSFDPIRTIIQSRKATATIPFIEFNFTTLTTAFGGGTMTTISGGYKYTPPAAGTQDEVTGVIDIVDGEEMYRLVMERCIVAGSVNAQLVKNAFTGLPVTVTALAPVTLPTAWHLVGSNSALAS
jgi:hypothetical protein